MAGTPAPPSTAAAVAAVRVLLETEDRFRADPQHGLTVQGGLLTPWMRRDLIDWMAEVRLPVCPTAFRARSRAATP